MVFIHVYHSKAWLVDDYRDPALETNITTTVTGAATRESLFEPDPKISNQPTDHHTVHIQCEIKPSHRRGPRNSFAMYAIREE